MQHVISAFADFGALLIAICIIAAATAATAICTGIFLEQAGTKIFSISDDWCVRNGLKTGAVLGFAGSIFAIYQVGLITAFLSFVGLCVTLLIAAGLVCLIADWCSPYTPNPDFD